MDVRDMKQQHFAPRPPNAAVIRNPDRVLKLCSINYSHSIMTGFDKPLIALEAAFQSDIFADIFTVILTSIPSRAFHYLSTCIENNRRLHNNSLSRCIAIYWRNIAQCPHQCPSNLGQRNTKNVAASNHVTHCNHKSFHNNSYRQTAHLEERNFLSIQRNRLHVTPRP